MGFAHLALTTKRNVYRVVGPSEHWSDQEVRAQVYLAADHRYGGVLGPIEVRRNRRGIAYVRVTLMHPPTGEENDAVQS